MRSKENLNMKSITILICAAILLAACIAIKPTERIQFEAPDAYPEGVAFDSVANVYYVSSARTGAVAKVTPEGIYTAIHTDSMLRSSYGVRLHPDGKRLYVCVSDANYSRYSSQATKLKLAKVLILEVPGGRKVNEIDLSSLVPGPHFINDLAFDPSGNAYVTDSYADVIYKIDGSGKASIFSRSELFHTNGIGLNGIVYHPGGFLLVDATGTGGIYKVPLGNPDNVQKVRGNQFLIGADGLLLSDTNLLTVVVNGGNDKIYQLKTDDGWSSMKLAGTTPIADRFTYPATATRNGKDVWIMNANFHELNDSNAIPSKYFAIQKAVFKPVPKKFAETDRSGKKKME